MYVMQKKLSRFEFCLRWILLFLVADLSFSKQVFAEDIEEVKAMRAASQKIVKAVEKHGEFYFDSCAQLFSNRRNSADFRKKLEHPRLITSEIEQLQEEIQYLRTLIALTEAPILGTNVLFNSFLKLERRIQKLREKVDLAIELPVESRDLEKLDKNMLNLARATDKLMEDSQLFSQVNQVTLTEMNDFLEYTSFVLKDFEKVARVISANKYVTILPYEKSDTSSFALKWNLLGIEAKNFGKVSLKQIYSARKDAFDNLNDLLVLMRFMMEFVNVEAIAFKLYPTKVLENGSTFDPVQIVMHSTLERRVKPIEEWENQLRIQANAYQMGIWGFRRLQKGLNHPLRQIDAYQMDIWNFHRLRKGMKESKKLFLPLSPNRKVSSKEFEAMQMGEVDPYLPREIVEDLPWNYVSMGSSRPNVDEEKKLFSEVVDLPFLVQLLSHGLYEVEIGFTHSHQSTKVDPLEQNWLLHKLLSLFPL